METLSLPILVLVVYLIFRFNKSIARFENSLEDTVKFGGKHIDYQLDSQSISLSKKYAKLEGQVLKNPDKFSSRTSFRATMKEVGRPVAVVTTDK